MKINLTTLGCPKNIVDSEFMLGGLQGKNVEFVSDPLEAETIILNTCGFIQGAKEESIEAILQAVELKKLGGCERVFVTGCLSQRYPEELQKELPEVDGFYGNRDLKRIIYELANELDLKHEILGERLLITPGHYAYLKISEGCENPCTFCAIPAIRGNFRSRTVEELFDEAQKLAGLGVRELILVAQDTTAYGEDLYGEKLLVSLLDKLSEIKEFKWIRLLYTYPGHFPDELFDFLADNKKVYNYIDMPIQHVSNRLLQSMGRKTRRAEIENTLAKLRQNNTDIAIRSTLIVGFPGETEEEHAELKDFLLKMRFERLGVFAFSPEEGTPANNFSNLVPEFIVQERLSEINDLQNCISLEQNKAKIGRTLQVLVDEFDTDSQQNIGRTHYDCPEIDNTVNLTAPRLQIGRFYNVKITGCSDYELTGKLADKISPL